MPFVRVACLRQIPPGAVIEVMVDGNPYALCNVEGELHALWGVCPHQGAPLGFGTLNGDLLTCPWHAWDFDCRTGENTFQLAESLPVFEVRTDGEDVLLRLPLGENA